MGCPDWRRCFGQWVPPTSVNQLPVDYKEKFAAFRDHKNQKFARYLQAVGLNTTAQAILNDQSILLEADFNAAKTWIEYINRLVGVAIGLLIIAVCVRGFMIRKIRPAYFWVSLATLVTVIIQGWFGSIVVSTNLTSWTITVHMLMAFVLVAFLIWLYQNSGEGRVIRAPGISAWVAIASITLLLVQVFLGTEVRAAIDQVAAQLPRNSWVEGTGADFLIHRSFSWLVLGFHGFLAYILIKSAGWNPLTVGLIVLPLLTILTGAGLAYLSMPGFLQPVHLLLATVAFGFQFLVYLRLETNKQEVSRL